MCALELIERNVIRSEIYKGICHKEHDEALEILLVNSYNDDIRDGMFSLKASNCCYILKGEVDKRIKLLDSTELDVKQLFEVGRALFDAKRFNQSREYFEKLLAEKDYRSSYLYSSSDGLSKILILKNENPNTIVLLESMANPTGSESESYNYKCIHTASIPFRRITFIICCSIQNNKNETENNKNTTTY